MRNLVAACLLLTVAWVPQERPAPPPGPEKGRTTIDTLCVAAWEELKFVNRRTLNEPDRQEYDRIIELLERARSATKNSTQGGEMPGAYAMAREAATRAHALVWKTMKLRDYRALAERYLAGDNQTVVELSGWLAADLDRLANYLEASGIRGLEAGGLENAAAAAVSPATGEFTTRILAACVLLHTQVAFDAPQPGRHLSVARSLLALLGDARLPAGFRRQWYLAVGGHLQGQMDLLGATSHADDSVAVFPDDAEILVAAGSLYEMLAMPALDIPSRFTRSSVFAADMVSTGEPSGPVQRKLLSIRENRGIARSRAEELYRQAIARNAEFAEAHLRLGRILYEKGEADPAMKEIRLAAKSADSRIRYLAALFAGAVDEAAGKTTAAVGDYRRAMHECADCLTGGVALSHALRRAGDRDEAAAILDAALARDRQNPADDPWWDYATGNLFRRDTIFYALRIAIFEQ